MNPKDKFKLRKTVKKMTDQDISIKQLNVIASFFDSLMYETKKNNQMNRMWMRVVYFILFLIVFTYAVAYIGSIKFSLFTGLFCLYNLIHFIQEYFVYYKNYKNIDEKNSQ